MARPAYQITSDDVLHVCDYLDSQVRNNRFAFDDNVDSDDAAAQLPEAYSGSRCYRRVF